MSTGYITTAVGAAVLGVTPLLSVVAGPLASELIGYDMHPADSVAPLSIWVWVAVAAAGASLASTTLPRTDDTGLAKAAMVCAWLAVAFFIVGNASWLRVIPDDAMASHKLAMLNSIMILVSTPLVIVFALAAMGMTAKIAHDHRNKPFKAKTPESEKATLASLAVGNGVVGVLVLWSLFNFRGQISNALYIS